MNVKTRFAAFWLTLAALLLLAPAALAEDAPPYTLDYAAETLQVDTTKCAYLKCDDDLTVRLTPDADGRFALGSCIAAEGEAAKTLSFWDKSDKPLATLVVPVRAAAPQLTADWQRGEVTLATDAPYRFCYWDGTTAPTGTGWLAGAAWQAGSGRVLTLLPGKTLCVQLTATDTAFASAVAFLPAAALRPAPDAAVLLPTTAPQTLTVTALPDCEYRLLAADGSVVQGWQPCAALPKDAAGNVVFGGLTPDTAYTVALRLPAQLPDTATGAEGLLAGAAAELPATTAKAATLRIIPTEATPESAAYAGLEYDVYLPADATAYTIDTAQLPAARGLNLAPGQTDTLPVTVTANPDGSLTCTPATWRVCTVPTADFTPDPITGAPYTTMLNYKATDNTPLLPLLWTYTRVGSVAYGALPLPQGYRLAQTGTQPPDGAAIGLYFVAGSWQVRPTSLVVTVEPILTPTATPTASPTATPTASPTAAPTGSPTATPSAAPTASPTAAPVPTQTPDPTATPTATPDSGGHGGSSDDDDSTPTPTPTPLEVATAVPTAVPAAAPAPAAPISDPTAGRLTPGKVTQSSSGTGSGTGSGAGTTAAPTAAPTETPAPTPTPSPEPATATPEPETPPDATPEDGNADATAPRTPLWLNLFLLALAGGGLVALWLVVFYLPKKRREEMDIFKSHKDDDKT